MTIDYLLGCLGTNKSPRAEVWKQAIHSYPISIPSSDDSLKILLGDVEERVISKAGIEFNYLFYNSDRLQLLRQHYETEDGRGRNRISQVEPLVLNSMNSGISDFSSVFGTVKENDRESTLIPEQQAPDLFA